MKDEPQPRYRLPVLDDGPCPAEPHEAPDDEVLDLEPLPSRPTRRSACPRDPDAPACAFVGCKWNLLAEAAIDENVDVDEVVDDLVARDLASTCALVAAEQGPLTLAEVADRLGGRCRERARQLEHEALRKLEHLGRHLKHLVSADERRHLVVRRRHNHNKYRKRDSD